VSGEKSKNIRAEKKSKKGDNICLKGGRGGDELVICRKHTNAKWWRGGGIRLRNATKRQELLNQKLQKIKEDEGNTEKIKQSSDGGAIKGQMHEETGGKKQVVGTQKKKLGHERAVNKSREPVNRTGKLEKIIGKKKCGRGDRGGEL